MMKYLSHLSILVLIVLVALLYEEQMRARKLYALKNNVFYSYSEQWMPWLIVFGYLAILAGFRSGMNDTSVYISIFRNTEASWPALYGSIDGDVRYAGSNVLAILFKMFISEDYHAWFMTWAVIESILLADILRRESVSFLDACFYFFASTLYYNYFSMMRQWMAVVITFWAARYIRDGKFIWYCVVCGIAATFHVSALIMIPAYFLVRGEAWNTRQLLLIAAFSVGMMFLSPIMSALETAAQGTTYDYAIAAMASSSGSSFIRAVIAAVPVSLAFMERRDIKNPMMNICVNMSVLNLLLNILASFTSGLYVIRLATYMGLFNVILYPYLLNATSNRYNRLIKILFYVAYLAFYFYQMSYMRAWGYKSDVLTWLVA